MNVISDGYEVKFCEKGYDHAIEISRPDSPGVSHSWSMWITQQDSFFSMLADAVDNYDRRTGRKEVLIGG